MTMYLDKDVDAKNHNISGNSKIFFIVFLFYIKPFSREFDTKLNHMRYNESIKNIGKCPKIFYWFVKYCQMIRKTLETIKRLRKIF